MYLDGHGTLAIARCRCSAYYYDEDDTGSSRSELAVRVSPFTRVAHGIANRHAHMRPDGVAVTGLLIDICWAFPFASGIAVFNVCTLIKMKIITARVPSGSRVGVRLRLVGRGAGARRAGCGLVAGRARYTIAYTLVQLSLVGGIERRSCRLESDDCQTVTI
jgi:hypothetical protein